MPRVETSAAGPLILLVVGGGLVPGDGIGLVLLASVIALSWYLSFIARRLDRLHRRVEGAAAELEDQLGRRTAAAVALADSGLLPQPDANKLRRAALATTGGGDRPDADSGRFEAAHSDLSRTLRSVLDPLPDHDAVLSGAAGRDLARTCQRVLLARRFHNDAVSTAAAVRRKRVVRMLRLAGRAPWPRSVEIDDQPPRVLSPIG